MIRARTEQFRAGLNLVMSGIPYWTTDIGGYNGGNVSSPQFRESSARMRFKISTLISA